MPRPSALTGEHVPDADLDIPLDNPRNAEATGDFRRWVNRRWPDSSRTPDALRPVVPVAPGSAGSR